MLLDRRKFQKKTSHQKLFCEVKEGIQHETWLTDHRLCVNMGFMHNLRQRDSAEEESSVLNSDENNQKELFGTQGKSYREQKELRRQKSWK